MRYLNIVLCMLMLVFIGVQYNDPDGPMWMLIYLVPASWAAVAAFRARWLARPLPNALLLSSMALAAYGVVHYWPDAPRWWAKEVWYVVETAREGMGMMIVLLVLAVAWSSGRRAGGASGGVEPGGSAGGSRI